MLEHGEAYRMELAGNRLTLARVGVPDMAPGAAMGFSDSLMAAALFSFAG